MEASRRVPESRSAMRRTSCSSPSTRATWSPSRVSIQARAVLPENATCTPSISPAGSRSRRERSSAPSKRQPASSACTSWTMNATASAAVAIPITRCPTQRSKMPHPTAAAASSAEKIRAESRRVSRNSGPGARVRSLRKLPRTRSSYSGGEWMPASHVFAPQKATSMSTEKCRVLIVDDDADTRDALADALGDAGFLVEQAPSGAKALEWIDRNGEPDVILLDLRMPGMDGAQFLERTRGSAARVIVLTGDASARLVRFARDAKLLSKPIDLIQLEAAVKEACAA